MTDEKQTHIFSVRMTREQGAAFQAMADELGVTRGWLIKRLLSRFQKEQNIKKIAKELGFDSLTESDRP